MRYITTDTELTSVADAIRRKTGIVGTLEYPNGFIEALDTSLEEKNLNFFDYDGTLVYSYTLVEAQNLTELPSNPQHSGLIAQGWNWTLNDIKTHLSYTDHLNVGQMYITDDGTTRFYIELDENSLDINFAWWQNLSSDCITIDWGDNSPIESLSTNLTSYKGQVDHIYNSPGQYIIKVRYTEVNNDRQHWHPKGLTETNTFNSPFIKYPYILKKVEFGEGVTVLGGLLCNIALTTITTTNLMNYCDTYNFFHCHSLQYVTIPPEMTIIRNYNFNNCYNLKNISLPKVTSISYNCFTICYKLQYIDLTQDLTTLSDCAIFNQCKSLKKFYIPPNVNLMPNFSECTSLQSFTWINNITALPYNFLQSCYSIKELTIPSTVASIDTNFLGSMHYCSFPIYIHFLSTTPPTISSSTFKSNSFNSNNIIYVPYSADHSILNAYKTATYWADIADLIQEEPQ